MSVSHQARSWTHAAATTFYEWLVVREDEVLPQLHDIGKELSPKVDPYRLAAAIQWLRRQGMLEVASGSKGAARGKYLIRVRSTGRVYRSRDAEFLKLPDEALA